MCQHYTKEEPFFSDSPFKPLNDAEVFIMREKAKNDVASA